MGKKKGKGKKKPIPPLPEREPPAIYSKRKYFWTIDFIAMRIDVPGKCLEEKELTKMKFNFFKKNKPKITPDRIDVANFCDLEPLKQFKAQPTKLAAKLLYRGIKLNLVYGKDKIGKGVFTISEAVAYRILNMVPPRTICQTQQVMLTKKKKTTALVTIKFRLEIICIPPKPDTGKKKKKRRKGKKKGKKGKK